MEIQKSEKAKLLQYAERVLDLRTGSDDERVDAAIKKTEAFFESMGNPPASLMA